MNQESLNPDGYVYPQIGFFVGEIIEMEVGFSSSHPDDSWVQGWLDRYTSELEKFYGPAILARVRDVLNSIYAGPDDGATWEAAIDLLIRICADEAVKYECDLALL